METISHGSFVFYNGFDSANLARVAPTERNKSDNDNDNAGKSCEIDATDCVDFEFDLWTKHDCQGTQYQNNNRTWFYFGMKSRTPGATVRLNFVNLNKQAKMFSQGMCPVFKIIPGHPHWERIREKPTYALDERGSDFTLSFVHRVSEDPKAVTYFAFTYPFSYTDLQNYLRRIDIALARRESGKTDDIYYHRECAIRSLEGRRLDVITVSSYRNITTEREDKLPYLFPNQTEERAFKFREKKIIFVSARVHPGETPSSFVLNGFLNFLLNRDDQIAADLRRLYVFKFVPMLNPDGVARGHYRTDTRGVNLNRVYLDPSLKDHPTIFAARSLIRYYHCSYWTQGKNFEQQRVAPAINDGTTNLLQRVTLMTLNESENMNNQRETEREAIVDKVSGERCIGEKELNTALPTLAKRNLSKGSSLSPEDTNLCLYIDLHGHASKKGVFMYGNHFEDPEDVIACMLLPKLMSINNPNFHFASCNFTERNMYLIDKRDGMSREGSGRVAVYKTTGLIRCYTLECNYNTGRLVNVVPPKTREATNKIARLFAPPKYNPTVFEAVGAALGPSILDLTESNPNSRLPNSQFRSLRGVRSYLKLTYANAISESRKESSAQKDRRDVEKGKRASPLIDDCKVKNPPKLINNNNNNSNRNNRNNRNSSGADSTIESSKINATRSTQNGRNVGSFYAKRRKIAGRSRRTKRRRIKSKIDSTSDDFEREIRKTANSNFDGDRTKSVKIVKHEEPGETVKIVKHGAKRLKIVIPRETTERLKSIRHSTVSALSIIR